MRTRVEAARLAIEFYEKLKPSLSRNVDMYDVIRRAKQLENYLKEDAR